MSLIYDNLKFTLQLNNPYICSLKVTFWHQQLNGHQLNSGSWWWTEKPGVLQSVGSPRITRLDDWTELNFGDRKRRFITHVNPWLFYSNVWQNSLQIKKKKKEEVYGILTLFHILTKMIMKVCLFCKNFFSCTPRDLYTFLYVFKLNRVPFKIIF